MECARGWRPPTRIAEFAARLFISSTAWMQRCVVVTCQCPRIDSCRLGVVGPVEYGTSGALIARDLDPAGCGASRQLCVSLPATSRPDECTSPEACWRTAECGAVSGKVGPGALCGRQSRMSRSRCGSLCRGRQHATAPSRPVPCSALQGCASHVHQQHASDRRSAPHRIGRFDSASTFIACCMGICHPTTRIHY